METLSRAKHATSEVNRWCFASIGFPVIAGTFCTKAIMFNICALAQGWHVAIDVDKRTFKLNPPGWVIALRAVSLALGAIAYFLYFVTMASNYDRVKGFTITVSGWFISAVILFSLISVEVREHRKIHTHRTLEYTQSFFAGVIAAGLYTLIAIVLASYTACVRSLHLNRADRRKVECTSIMIRALTFATILLAGAAIYSNIENWSLIEALYFTDYTVLTIGIGNLVPTTHLGRSLLFPYATAGIISLGHLVTSVASFTNDMRKLKLRYKIEELRKVIHNHGNWEKTSNGTATTRARFPKAHEVLDLHRIKTDFYRRRRWKEFVFFLSAWFLLWLCSAAVFRRSEQSQDWTYFTALYFTYTSLTTIGYGDFHPTSNFGIVFFIFWSLIALPILTNLVTITGQVFQRILVFTSTYIWKKLFLKAHRWQHHHRHEHSSQPYGAEDKNAMNNSVLHREARAGSKNESHNQSPPVNGPTSEPVEIEKPESSSPKTGLGFGSMKALTQYKLRLAEEIKKLTFALADQSLDDWEELRCTWHRILPLLHAGENDAGIAHELTASTVLPKSEYIRVMKLMDPQKALSERNTEISWMLTLLVEKLCLDLKKELNEAS